MRVSPSIYFVNLSVCLSTYNYVRLYFYLYVCPSIFCQFVCLSFYLQFCLYLCVCPSIFCQFACLSFYLQFWPFVFLSMCLSVYFLSICLSVFLPTILPVCILTYVSVRLFFVNFSVCLSTYNSVSIYASVRLFFVNLPVCLSTYNSVRLYFYLCVCPSVFLSKCLSVYFLSIFLSIIFHNFFRMA
jgi:hypothetical protein